jgi:Cdc6-like AAA superfamily ATPase/DNA-binding MarR family transcriptional regulator
MHSRDVLQKFADATQSLKLYRRAELRDEATYSTLIEKLYVDPLPNEAVLETMLRPNTTLLVGRKGTGKSTVFQRAQHEIRKRKRHLSAYIDIKTIYESAEVDPAALEKLSSSSIAASDEELKKILLYRAFCKAVFAEIQSELKLQIDGSWIERAKEFVGTQRKEVMEKLDTLIDDAFDDGFIDATKYARVEAKSATASKDQKKATAQSTYKLDTDPTKFGLDATHARSHELNAEHSNAEDRNYSRILLRTFSINQVMQRLVDLLDGIKFKHLYIFIDDFSELPEEAMQVFVDAILAPLNNWSNEVIKFKIAGYPGRVYLGKIDSTKIDEIHLDTYHLYGTSDISTMEEKAIDFTRRLLASRFDHYLSKPFDEFCESGTDEIYRHLFFASGGNARNLGHILFNLRETHVSYGKVIGLRAISEASRRYYEEKIEPYFGIQKFAHESFGERSSIFSLKELLESLVERAKQLRTYKESSVTQAISGRTPSSHFHILSELDGLLNTLELNFFLTKYYEMKDRDGRKVSVYALNHGLCSKYTIAFGRPTGKREFRLYYVERVFDYTPILKGYIERNQELKCAGCGVVHGLDKLPSLKIFDMMCPSCKKAKCDVVNLSRKYEEVLRGIDDGMLLPATELGILNVLFTEKKDLFASDIAEELDCSFQLVGRRGKILAERGLVDRAKNGRNRRVFSITDQATTEYFQSNRDRKLDVSEE